MSSAQMTQWRDRFGGQMTEAEVRFSRQIQDLVRAALDGRVPFVAVAASLLSDLRDLRQTGFDADAAFAAGFKPSIVGATLPPDSSSPRVRPSESQREFLEDVNGLVDFATRNGLSFTLVLSVLTHDLTEIAAYGWDLDKAKADFFVPKAAGWAKRNAEPVGEPDEMVG